MTATPPENIRFRPSFRATAIAVPAFIVLVVLGAWQMQRLAWKTEIIAYREAMLIAPAVPLTDDLALVEYRRVTVSGEFLHDKEIFLAATRDGRFGFHVITPLARPDGSFVLIDRGWIPPGMREPWLRTESRLIGPVAINGLIRVGSQRNWLSPENDLEKNYWFWLEFAAMAQFAGIEAPAYMVEAGPAENPGGLPIGRAFSVNLSNDHLQYVIIWFSLAVALAVIFVLSQSLPAKNSGPEEDEI